MNEFIKVSLRADASHLEKGFAAGQAAVGGFRKSVGLVKGAVDKVDSAIKGVGVRAAGMSAALLAAMALSSKGAMEFETSMRNVNSIAQESEAQFSRTGDAVLAMSRKMPISAKIMADGLYDIASSGFQGAEGLEVLDNANKSAVAGMTETAVASKGITAVLNSYGLGAEHAADVSDILFKTVEVGVLTFEDLVQQIGDFAPLGQAAGIEFDQLGAAIAALTRGGFPAAQAATALTGVMRAFIKPSEAMKTAVHNLGYADSATMLKTRGLKGSIDDLSGSVDGNITAMGQMFQDTEGLRGVLSLTANGGTLFAEALDSIANEANRAGSAEDAYAEQSKATGAQVELMKNSITAARIEIGQYYLPVIGEAAKHTAGMVNVFNTAPGPVKGFTAGILALAQAGTAVGGTLLFMAVRQKLWTMAMKDYRGPLSKYITGTTSMTDAVIRASSAASQGDKIFQAVGRGQARVATAINRTRAPVASLSGVFDKAAAATNRYSKTNGILSGTSGRLSGVLSRVQTSTMSYARASSVAGSRTTRMAATFRRAASAGGILGRSMQAVRRHTVSMGSAFLAGLMVLSDWQSATAETKAEVDAMNESIAQKHDMSSLRGMSDAYDEMRQNIEEAKRASEANNDLAGDVRGGLQVLSPFHDNTVQKKHEQVLAEAAAMEELTRKFDNQTEVLSVWRQMSGLTSTEGERLAQVLGVDLTEGLSAAEHEWMKSYNLGGMTRDRFIELSEASGGAAGSILRAADAAMNGSFAVSTLGEQLAALHSPIANVTGDLVELTEQQKMLMSAMGEIGSAQTGFTDALSERKEAMQAAYDDEIEIAQRAGDDQMDAAQRAAESRIEAQQDVVDSMKDGTAEQKAAQDQLDALRDREQQSIEDLREGEQAALDARREANQQSVEDLKLTLIDYTNALAGQNMKLTQWKQNLVTVASTAGQDVANYLASMGTEGVDIVNLMATGTKEETDEMARQIKENMRISGTEGAVELSAGMTIASKAGEMGAKATREAVLRELGLLPGDVKGIMDEFADEIEAGINRILVGTGGEPIDLSPAPVAGDRDFIGPVNRSPAKRPTPPLAARGMIAERGMGVMFNEDPDGAGEAYIPFSKAYRRRAIGLWEETGRRLGLMPMASGGLLGFSGSPPPTTTHNSKVEKREAVNFNGPMYLSDAEATIRYAKRKKNLAKMRGEDG